MATYASKLRPSAVDGQTIRVLPDGRIRGNAGMEPFSAGTKGGAPATFYVDGNVVSSGNGLSWLSAVKTLAEGLALAQAYQSTSGNRAWAHRATVYACGDSLTEDLVLLAEKTDVIGVGTANMWPKGWLNGNHIPVTTAMGGCRFINWIFTEPDNGIMWTVTGTYSTGIQFVDCTFSSRSTVATTGIKSTACYNFKVLGCDFEASNATGGFSTGCIELKSGVSDNQIFRNNRFGGGIGIVIDNGVTNTAGRIWIDNNIFYNTTLCIDDNSDGGTGIAVVTNNMLVSDAALASGYDINLKRAAGNIATGASDSAHVPEINT